MPTAPSRCSAMISGTLMMVRLSSAATISLLVRGSVRASTTTTTWSAAMISWTMLSPAMGISVVSMARAKAGSLIWLECSTIDTNPGFSPYTPSQQWG